MIAHLRSSSSSPVRQVRQPNFAAGYVSVLVWLLILLTTTTATATAAAVATASNTSATTTPTTASSTSTRPYRRHHHAPNPLLVGDKQEKRTIALQENQRGRQPINTAQYKRQFFRQKTKKTAHTAATASSGNVMENSEVHVVQAEEEKTVAKDKTAPTKPSNTAATTTTSRTSSTSSMTTSSQTIKKGVKRPSTATRASNSNSSSNSNSNNNNQNNAHHHKQRRNLKGEGIPEGTDRTDPTAAAEGTGKLKVTKEIALKTRTFIECKERIGKKCKRSPVDDSPGERRRERLTMEEGSYETIVQPDYTLLEESTLLRLDANTKSYQHTYYDYSAFPKDNTTSNVGGIVTNYAKRFYTITAEAAADAATNQEEAEGMDYVAAMSVREEHEQENENEQLVPSSASSAATTEEFIPRAIPNRYSNYHNQHASLGISSSGSGSGSGSSTSASTSSTNRVFETAVKESTNSGAAGKRKKAGSTKAGPNNNGRWPSSSSASSSPNSATMSSSSTTGTTADMRNNFSAQNSLYSPTDLETQTTVEDQNADDTDADTTAATDDTDDTDDTAGDDDATGTATATADDNTAAASNNENDQQQGRISTEIAYDQYEAWFNEEDGNDDYDDGDDGDDYGEGDDGDDTDTDAEATAPFLVQDDSEGGNANENTADPSFFEDEDDYFEEEEEEVGDDEKVDMEGQYQDVATESPQSGSYFSAQESNPETTAPSESQHIATLDGNSSMNNGTISPTGTATETIEESLTVHQEQDSTGITLYQESVAASPVYVETKGSVDLSQRKEDVFESLEPLLSSHLEKQFGDDLIQDYQLTITYVTSEHSVLQERRGSDAKTYITQLVVLVVLHVRSQERDLVAAITPEYATASVQSFFDDLNPEKTLFLRVLNAKGLYTREIQAQGVPHPPRNHEMEHGISHITPTNLTQTTDVAIPEEGTDEKVWSFMSLIDDIDTKTAVIASATSGAFVILALVGALFYNRGRRQKIVARSRAIMDTASDYGSGAYQTIQTRVRRNPDGRYLNLNFGNRKSSAASTRSDASSNLSYIIQPAAIQLRRKRPSTVHVSSDAPLAGRQDDAFDKDKKPSSIYDIDIDNDNDLVGVRSKSEDNDNASLPDERDYESQHSISSEDDDQTDDSRGSVDRISLARNAMAVEQYAIKETFVDEDEESGINRYAFDAAPAPDSPESYLTRGSSHSSHSSRSGRSSSGGYTRPTPSDDMMTQTVPLSPLSAALAEALEDTPRPHAYTATSRPRTPPSVRRRGMDPPPSYHTSYPNDYYYQQASPPASMQDIMDTEYINKKRWQDEIDDDTVDLPDHMSAGISRSSSANTSRMTAMTSENRLVLHPNEGSKRSSYQYRY